MDEQGMRGLVESQSFTIAKAEKLATHEQQAGRFLHAIDIYTGIIAQMPDHFASYCNRALALHALHRYGEALMDHDRAIALNPAHPIAHYNRGLTLYQLRQYDEAEESFKQAIAFKPDFAQAYNNLGLTLHELFRSEEALIQYDHALALNQGFVDAYNNKGNSLQVLKRYVEALANYNHAIALNPANGSIWCNRANALKEMKRVNEAMADYDHAIALWRDCAEAYLGKGIICQTRHMYSHAHENYGRAIELNPDFAEAYNALGNLSFVLHRFEDALLNYDKALVLKPHYAEALNNKGNVLKQQLRYNEALAAYNGAITINPAYIDVYNNRGILYYERGQYANALADFEHAIAHAPGDAEGWWNKSMVMLLKGDYETGWKLYEWRWKRNNQNVTRSFEKPLWLGQEIPAHSTILIHAEQGFGDTLQFCRYIPMIAAQYKVVFESYSALLELMQYNFPDIKLVETASASSGIASLPDHDYHIPVMSLPLALGTTIETIPASLYLKAPPKYEKKWHSMFRKVENTLYIGLCWAGGKRPDNIDSFQIDTRRSLHFDQLKPLLDIKNTTFVSLQLGLPATEINDERVADFSSRIVNWCDTAAIISHLDLVISADTAVCHLSAAMGKPTFLLNRYDTCWRWLLNRDDSPWYPSLVQFRQPAPGDWETVIDNVAARLESFN